MGVTGLLPVLKSIQDTKSLREYSGQCLAIDGYAWLHRAVFSCTYELTHDVPTQKYLQFFKKRIHLLRDIYNVEPYFVFDGDYLSLKADTEKERDKSRQENKALGMKFLSAGDSKKGYDLLSKSVDVSPAIAKTVIDYLRAQSMKYVVAPYEADSQMVYLEKLGLVDGIISEDSDLLVFGCRRLLTKFNDKACTVIEIDSSRFGEVKDVRIGLMTPQQLRLVACISGCDYTSGIPRIGIKKAFQAVWSHKAVGPVLKKLRLDKYQIPAGFLQEYERADCSFKHQRVFNPLTLAVECLNDLGPEVDLLMSSYIGDLRSLEVHRAIASGVLDPISKEILVSREEQVQQLLPKGKSIARSYSVPVSQKKQFMTIDMFLSQRSGPELATKVKTHEKPSGSKPATHRLVERKLEILHSTKVSAATQSKFFTKSSMEKQELQELMGDDDLEDDGFEVSKENVPNYPETVQSVKEVKISDETQFKTHDITKSTLISESRMPLVELDLAKFSNVSQTKNKLVLGSKSKNLSRVKKSPQKKPKSQARPILLDSFFYRG